MDTAARGTGPHSEVSASSDAETAAVLYVCVERSESAATLAEERAVEEGHSFASRKNLRIVAEVTDPFGERDPDKRPGWQRVRGIVAGREVSAVIVRWPDVLSPNHEMRYSEIAWCQERGVRVLFSWKPLANMGAEGR